MPQKLNKAGKMQDYIPKGNGDASGEYGTNAGTGNKNVKLSSGKKETKANVITENKSVKVIPFKEWIKKEGNKERLEKGIPNFLNSRELREYYDEKYEEIRDKYAIEKDQNKRAEYEKQMDKIQEERKEAYSKLKENGKEVIYDGKKEIKANIINDDLTGKSKAKEINDFSKMFDSDDLTITFENDKYKYAKSGVDGMKKNQFLETLGATVSNKKQREKIAHTNDGKWTFNVKDNKTGKEKSINLTNDELYSLWNKVKAKGDLTKKGNTYYSESWQKERKNYYD